MRSQSNHGEEFVEATASESQARAEAVLPNKGSEDASHLLHQWVVERQRYETAKEDTDYLPNGKVDWVVNLDFAPDVILKKANVKQAFSQSWREKHDYPELFGFSPEEKRWTFVLAGDAPDSYSKLQLAWKLRSLDDDQPLTSDRLHTYLAAARTAGFKLKATKVQANTPPEEGATRSARLLKLVKSCDSDPLLVLKATKKGSFDGKAIWDVMLSLGLRWGDMDLFHWDNPGIPGDDCLFSVWTSTPPGYFLPEQIARGRVHTDDLVFGFSLARTWQPELVAESMIRAIQYAKRRLGGRILDVHSSESPEVKLKAEIRETVTILTNAGFAPGSAEALYLF